MSEISPTPAKYWKRKDDSLGVAFGDPFAGYHEQFDFYGSEELAEFIVDAVNSRSTLVAQNEWLKDRLADLQLPASSQKNIEEWLFECGMPSGASLPTKADDTDTSGTAGAGSDLTFPRELTDDLRDVLSTMLWTSGKISACLRAGGEQIKTRAEDEQAHVLHWLICLSLEHGDGWRAKASDRIREIQSALSPNTETAP